jgi:hypothetical protein
MRVKQVSWTNGDALMEPSLSGGDVMIFQSTATPRMAVIANGLPGLTTAAGGPPLGSDFSLACVLNGANSVIHFDSTSLSGATGTTTQGGAMTGLSVGARQQLSSFSNIQVKEICVFSAAHDLATRNQMIAYLSGL